jgi:hypothetical protein
MNRSSTNQAGFIPLLIMLFLILVVVIGFVFFRVMHAHQ